MNEPNEPASGLPTYPMPRTAFHYSPELFRHPTKDIGPSWVRLRTTPVLRA
jgi:hypothetical protein